MSHQVRLRNFPGELFAAFDEASDSLLRDYLLSALSGDQPFSAKDVSLAREAKQRVGDAAGDAGENASAADVTVLVSDSEAATFSLLQAVLDHANRLAREGALLVLPVLPEVVRLRNWICDEVTRQVNGEPALAWQPLSGTGERPVLPAASWPGLDELPLDQPWVVGDDGNQIIAASPPALRLLGWDSLVGERILAIIPPELRERHVVAFTRGVATGVHHLLDQPLALHGWTRDGRSVPVTLTLSRYPAQRGRTVFLARLEARPE